MSNSATCASSSAHRHTGQPSWAVSTRPVLQYQHCSSHSGQIDAPVMLTARPGGHGSHAPLVFGCSLKVPAGREDHQLQV